jgi:hypothetical protein
MDIGNSILNRTPIAQEMRARIDKWDCIKLKTKHLHRKRNNEQNEKKLPTERDKTLASYLPYRG